MSTNTDTTKTLAPETRKDEADFIVQNHGSILLFTPISTEADMHIRENVSEAMWYGGALVVEHRYASDLANALMDEGFDVRLRH